MVEANINRTVSDGLQKAIYGIVGGTVGYYSTKSASNILGVDDTIPKIGIALAMGVLFVVLVDRWSLDGRKARLAEIASVGAFTVAILEVFD